MWRITRRYFQRFIRLVDNPVGYLTGLAKLRFLVEFVQKKGKSMKLNTGASHKNRVAFIVIISLFLLVAFASFTGVFDYLEFKIYDLRVNLFAESVPASEEIVVVLLDQQSLDWAKNERGWSWPWPRKAYAEFVEYMKEAGAKSLAFDMLFTEPSVHRNARQEGILNDAAENLEQARLLVSEGRSGEADSYFREIAGSLRDLSAGEDDAAFVQAEKDFGRVVQAVFFSTGSGSVNSWPPELDKPLFELSGFEALLPLYARLSGNEGETWAQFPIEELKNAAGILGSVTGWPDSDGIIRRANLFTLFDGRAVPGLSTASLLVSGHDNKLVYDPGKRLVRWGGYTIPVDRKGRCILRYRGRPDRYYPYFMDQALKSAESHARGEEPELPPGGFKDKYVFFGLYAPGLYDIFATPISATYPGAGVHITMLDNILNGDFIRESPLIVDLLLVLTVIVLTGMLGLYPGKIAISVAGTLAVFILVTFLGLAAYDKFNLWLPMIAPFTGIVLAFITTSLYNYATEGSQKRFIKSAFSRYLAPSVIEQIISDPSKLKLGGQKLEMTALFTDIQRFSSISEALQKEYADDGPKVLVNLLNLYLTEMSNIVLDNQGTIDKYEGDAIIAFFGAPLWTERHAILACRSAIQMKKRELELREEIMKSDGPFCAPLSKLIEKNVIRAERPLYTRLGINSGSMVVGNMGTPNKMDYTVMGNAVNLAARLEGVNKQYDTRGILISEYTRNNIGDEFIVRRLSRVTVVGINTPLRLYELLAIRDEASAETLDMVRIWEQGFAAYEKKEFAEAEKIFAELYRKDSGDGAAKLYMDRCGKYIGTRHDWDCVDNLTEK
jgi:adenylate cyclase